MALIDKLTAIADAIRAKTGGTDALTLDAMATEIAAIETGGDIDALIDRSITEVSSNATSVGSNAFKGCTKLTTVDFPAATGIGGNAFDSCSKLTTADFPLVVNIGLYAFRSCSALATADFPSATRIGSNTFDGCSALTTVDFPLVTNIDTDAFAGCSALTTVDFPLVTNIGGYAFDSCYSLTALILRSETMATLGNINAFTKCYHILGTTNSTYNPDGLADGYIYVPSALVATYQAATNWTTYSTQFRALEDYTVDGTTTGALDPSKI